MSNPQQQQQQQQQQPLPLFDLFLDMPHPGGVESEAPVYSYGCPATSPEIATEVHSNLSRISLFAFPEFDEGSHRPQLPRNARMNRFSQYVMQPTSFTNYTFSLQLKSGVRVHGFVRRYLPVHPGVRHRYDVGRRGERALVLLTRCSGGDLLYASVLKTIETISFQKAALDPKYSRPEPQKWFLNRLVEEHQKMCRAFVSVSPTNQKEPRKPAVMSIGSIEVGGKLSAPGSSSSSSSSLASSLASFHQADTTHFLVPTSLLLAAKNNNASTGALEASASTSTSTSASTSSPMLPLLRVLGVSSTLRLLSALLSENRVLLVADNPTRLTQCARSALSILAQGLLNWQHLYIPVLPPHLFGYLGAPVPYLVGMHSSLVPKLNEFKDRLGEMVIINLDTNQMETRGINPAEAARKVPDLFQKPVSEQGMPASGTVSASEMLAQDLFDLLKLDKRVIYGESTLTNVSETAAKATKAVKSGISNLARKGKKFFNNRKQGSDATGAGANLEEELVVDGAIHAAPDIDPNAMSPDAVYIQGSSNVIAEEHARIAFSSFFLTVFGNMRWYLSAKPGQLPQLDRNRFLQQKRAMGDGESTPIWPLLQNFSQSQMLEDFAKARIDEVRLRVPNTPDAPLFTQCANYHRLNDIDFSVFNVRRICTQVAGNNPSYLVMQTSVRRTAMLLTSNKNYEGDYNKAVAHLVEQCRESTAVLSDVMSVIWVRIRDCKNVHWKHGLQSLHLLRNLLYHGPLAAIAEASDGMNKIRAMKFYNDHMRSQICAQIRQAAHQLYNLLVDRAQLFHIRRICVNKRRVIKQPEQAMYVKNSRISIMHRFGAMHQFLNPNAAARVASAPHLGPPVNSSPGAPPAHRSMGPGPRVEHDIFGLTTPSAAAGVSADPAQGIIGLFSNFDVSSSTLSSSSVGLPPAPVGRVHDPFAPAPIPNNANALTPQPRSTSWNAPVSNQPGAAPSRASATHAQNPFSQLPVANNAQTQQNLVSQGSPVPTQQINRSSPQVQQLQLQHASGVPNPGQVVAYGCPQKPNVLTPHAGAPQQQYYQRQHSGEYNPTHPPSGPPQQAGYAMPAPQQQHHHQQQQQQQQHNQTGGYQYPPRQQQQQQQPPHYQHPPSQQQYVAQQAPPPAQPTKPSLSQFDPFQ